MEESTKTLIKGLRDAGLSEQAIKAAWPSWWDDSADQSESGRAELRFALARKLGLAPRSLLGERVEFVWQDDARFKNLTAEDPTQQAVLASFGVALGRLLLLATEHTRSIVGVNAMDLRSAILQSWHFVDLQSLLTTCWAVGVPVIHLRVFPLAAKSMRAMVVEFEGRHAILLGRDASYPAPIAFTLAHEIGHAALGHISGAKAIVDIGEPTEGGSDPQEKEADEYGLTLLTASSQPQITTSTQSFSALSLANAVMKAGPELQIEPGTLALCVGFIQQNWSVANAALRHIYHGRVEVWRAVNRLAAKQIQWNRLNAESAEYLQTIMSGLDGQIGSD